MDGLEQFKLSLLAQPCPGWLGLLGWAMTLSSIWLIPAYAIYLFTQIPPHSGSGDRPLLRPSVDMV